MEPFPWLVFKILSIRDRHSVTGAAENGPESKKDEQHVSQLPVKDFREWMIRRRWKPFGTAPAPSMRLPAWAAGATFADPYGGERWRGIACEDGSEEIT